MAYPSSQRLVATSHQGRYEKRIHLIEQSSVETSTLASHCKPSSVSRRESVQQSRGDVSRRTPPRMFSGPGDGVSWLHCDLPTLCECGFVTYPSLNMGIVFCYSFQRVLPVLRRGALQSNRPLRLLHMSATSHDEAWKVYTRTGDDGTFLFSCRIHDHHDWLETTRSSAGGVCALWRRLGHCLARLRVCDDCRVP